MKINNIRVTQTFENSTVPLAMRDEKAYNYGYAGMERDDEVAGEGNHYTAEYWEYSPRLARRWNVDPVVKFHESPYACLANNPIWFIDPNGADTTFFQGDGSYDSQAKKDFDHAFSTVKNRVSELQNDIKGIQNEITERQNAGKKTKSLEKKLASKQGVLENWQKLEADFDYIVSENTPCITYSTNATSLKPEENGKATTTYDANGNIVSAFVIFRSGKYSTIIHENRHTRQAYSMSKLDSEVEAFSYQQIYSYKDVQERIINALENQYPNPDFRPRNYGIREMVIYVYDIKE